MYDSSDGRFWLRCVLVLPFPGCATHTVRRSRDAPRCTVRFGATDQMRTLMRVPTSSDAPRCTVQFGALGPRCTMVQVHGDPNEPSLGAGAAVAPCVTLPCAASRILSVRRCRRRRTALACCASASQQCPFSSTTPYFSTADRLLWLDQSQRRHTLSAEVRP